MLSRMILLSLLLLAGLQAQPARRPAPAVAPLTINDFDSWRSIASQSISADGHWLAYSVFPEVGNGEVVVVNLTTMKETRVPAGALPIRDTVDPNAEPTETPAVVQGPKLEFSSNGAHLVFLAFPPTAEVDAARKAKKKPEEMPKNNLVIVATASGETFTSGQVELFQLAAEDASVVAYRKDAKEKTLVIRNLNSGMERSINETGEFTLSKDGKLVVYTVDAKQEDTNGVYSVATGSGDAPVAIAQGKGQYAKLTWDDSQKLLAVVAVVDGSSKLLGWKRGEQNAEEWVTPAIEGFRPRWRISTKGAVSFSSDGKRIFMGTVPPKRPTPKKAAGGDEEKAQFDLWHWKDDNVQTIQKVRANQQRDLSYQAVFNLESKTFVQLADLSVQRLTPNLQGDFAFASDDRPYRISSEWDARADDVYFLDTASGQRSLIARKARSGLNWSPDGRKAVSFDGKDWVLVNVKDTVTLKLTNNVGVRFDNEDDDHPRTPGPHGIAGWTKDSEWVLLYDKYDVWQFAVDGSISRMITRGLGRQSKIQFRYDAVRPVQGARANTGRDPVIDNEKLLLLRGESLTDYSTGYWTGSFDFDAEPKKLMWGAKNYKAVLRAKDSGAIVFTAASFKEPPDLYLTDVEFSKPKQVTRFSAQVSKYEWGTAELIDFRNLDGTPLKALLEKPANFDPRKKYPMIVYIYERRSNELHNFPTPRPTNSINAAFYTSNGYVVLQPDIVYKTGAPGMSSLQCVMPAVDAAVRLGFIDEANIGIQGHSWGGYQIAYMVTKTNRFKAASAGAPVANMTSAYDGIRYGSGLPRQFQYERDQSRIGGSLWEYPMRYIENSPVFAADKVETPLLMIHNDADDAVPWTQGIEFFLALRRNGKEAYLFNYNGEPHNLRKRANQKDYTMRLKQYFDYYLKGAPKPDWMERGIPYLERN